MRPLHLKLKPSQLGIPALSVGKCGFNSHAGSDVQQGTQTHRKRKYNERHNIRYGHLLDRVPYA
nr:MAG TPA: hypothetical protein [Caudoviricetes sp.]